MTCNPLSPDTYKAIVRIPLVNPCAFRWILANDPRDDIADSVIFVRDPSTVGKIGLNGAVIHMGTERLAQNPPFGKYHYISIQVDGEVAYPVDAPELQPPEVQSTGNRASLLKARITLDLGNARQRKFDFDIGAGVEFAVACYAVDQIEVLVPDPRVEIPNELVPVGDPGPFQLATVLTTTTYFTQRAPKHRNPLTYTVPLCLGLDAGEAFVPRVADSVAITGGTIPGGAPIVDFLYIPEGFREVSYSAPPSYFVLDSAVLLPGETRFREALIPGNANAFRVRGSSFVNFMQVLNA